MAEPQGTRIYIAGEDVSKHVFEVNLRRLPDDHNKVVLVMDVDRLHLHQDENGTQVLTLHIAEGLIA